jgi:tight adherence protein C
MISNAPGPTLLGFDVIVVGTMLAAVAAFAVMLAVYAAVTVKDPMAKRVKALSARRDELKAGIVKANARKRTSLVRRSDQTDRVKETLASMKVLQQSQIEAVQQKLAWAGYRNKELAVYVIGARMILPIVFGVIVFVMLYVLNVMPEWGSMKKMFGLTAAVGLGYKAPEIFLKNKATKRTDLVRKGLPDALDLLVMSSVPKRA